MIKIVIARPPKVAVAISYLAPQFIAGLFTLRFYRRFFPLTRVRGFGFRIFFIYIFKLTVLKSYYCNYLFYKNIEQLVIPAKAGIHCIDTFLDTCFRRYDSADRSV